MIPTNVQNAHGDIGIHQHNTMSIAAMTTPPPHWGAPAGARIMKRSRAAFADDETNHTGHSGTSGKAADPNPQALANDRRHA